MKLSKKILLGSMVLASSLFADVTTVLPYAASIDYTDNPDESVKKDGTLGGLYFSNGNLNYLFEMDFSHTNIKYKDTTQNDLEQNDFLIAYSGYFSSWMYKIGLHHITTTDTDLGDGDVLITAIGGYQTYGYDKFTYGIEGYYSNYDDGVDEFDVQRKINIYQVTPYVGYSNAIDINTRNDIKIKVNYVNSSDYIQNDYTSYEIEDTFYFKKVYVTLKAYAGEMKSGVKDSGHTVYNTKDLLKDGYTMKAGYAINKYNTISVSYAKNNFEEYGQTGTASNEVAVISLTYKY